MMQLALKMLLGNCIGTEIDVVSKQAGSETPCGQIPHCYFLKFMAGDVKLVRNSVFENKDVY
jgi:hypothetical protein